MFKNTYSLPVPFEILAREDMTAGEKLIYSLLRYRRKLSVNNPKFNDEKGTFVFFQQDEIIEMTSLVKGTVENAMKKLIKLGLVERVKRGRSYKYYLIPYDVDAKYIIGENAADDAQDEPNGDNPTNPPLEEQNVVEGQNNANSEDVDNSVDNIVDNLNTPKNCTYPIGTNFDNTGTKNMPKSEIGAKNGSIIEIGTKNMPHNNTLYKNTKYNNTNNHNKDLTLLKGHAPTVVIDNDLYNAYCKYFGEVPRVADKEFILDVLDQGVDKSLVVAAMKYAYENGKKWNDAKNMLKRDMYQPSVELSEEQRIAREKSMAKFKPFNYRQAAEEETGVPVIGVEPSELDVPALQLVFAKN